MAEIISKPATPEYRENFDRIFGRERSTQVTIVVYCNDGEIASLLVCGEYPKRYTYRGQVYQRVSKTNTYTISGGCAPKGVFEDEQ